MSTARDIMNRTAPVLSFDATVFQAIEFFKTHPQNFVAVFASKDRLQGVLTEHGLMRTYLKFQNQPDKEALIFYRELFEPAQLIHENESFSEVVKKLMTAVGHRVFVINADGEMIGQITTKDVLPFMTGKMGEKTQNKVPLDALKSQMYLYESFFSKSPFMMHSIGPEGQIQMANEILHAVLGYSYGELIGKTIFDLYSEANHQKASDGIQTIFNQGYHQVIQGEMVHKSGQKIAVELVSRALVDQNKNPIGTVTVSRPLDIQFLLQVLPQL